jgi:Zn-finger nucleic acid-binding protein
MSQEIRCPACRKFLKRQRDAAGLEIDACPSCYGIWFDADELGRFLRSEPLRKRFIWDEAVEPLRSIGYVMSTRARICPRCQVAMQETLFGGVSLDLCGRCKGIWLDDGELQRILEKFRRGEHGDRRVEEELRKGQADGEGFDLRSLFTHLLEFFKPGG